LLPYVSQEECLQPIDSASPEQIAARSTSDLAPILQSAAKRLPIAPFIVAATVLFTFLAGGSYRWVTAALLAGMILFSVLALWLDRYRRSVAVEFVDTGAIGKSAAALSRAFADLAGCASAWSIQAAGATDDWKRNAGASTLNDRKKIALRMGRPRPVRARTDFPCISFGRGAQLFLLPDAALFVRGRSIAALDYRDVEITQTQVRFIEEDRAPQDATVVGTTWRFVNRNGGPDRSQQQQRITDLPLQPGRLSLRKRPQRSLARIAR
jgi:hypothetical protein